MQSRLINPVVLAIAVLLAQWVGMVHRIEHHKLLEQPALHSSANILHDCLLFDALSTAHTPTCSIDHAFAPPQLSVIGKAHSAENLLPAHNPQARVRVRDPPFQS